MTTALQMSANAKSVRSSEERALDNALEALQGQARAFARLPIRDKRTLLRRTMDGVLGGAETWVADGLRAKDLPPEEGEEWLTGPVPTMRNLRLLAETLKRIEKGKGAIEGRRIRRGTTGRTEVDVFPTDRIDAALFAGFRIVERMQEGLSAGVVRDRAGSFYAQRDPEGGVALILGAGNVSSIPPMDALYKLFAEGLVCVVKMNPVNEWVGPHLERAFQPFIDGGFLRIVYGGADVGRYLVEHPIVADIHITGSDATHDLIVWGPPGPERDQRKRERNPVLKKRITSELGNVSPVAIVPAKYTSSELSFLSRNIAAMVTNNASFNCNAAKMLITAKQWPQRDRLLTLIGEALSKTPTRRAYYPGAFQRYEMLTAGRDRQTYGPADEERIPWTLIAGVDANEASEPLFSTEPFCGLLSETQLESDEPAEFLERTTTFMNDRLWGTLNAMIVVPPKLERSSEVGAALDRAIDTLRYGTVALNHWPALVYATASPAWGGHPSAQLEDIQSGLGWVHNTYLLEGIEKSVMRAPFTVFPKPVWFNDHQRVAHMGRRLLQMEYAPSWRKVPGLVGQALLG